MSNGYLVTPTAPAWRHHARILGAILGGGIPAALAVAALALGADVWVASLLGYAGLIGILIGAWTGPGVVAARDATSTAVRCAIKAAFLGTILLTAGYAATLVAADELYFVPLAVLLGLIIGMIVGTAMSVPVSVLSVSVLRRVARAEATPQ